MSSSSFGCGAGDHKICLTAAILGQRRNIVWLQHSIRISQEVLNIFQVQRAWPSWLTLSMRWNIQCIFFQRFIIIETKHMLSASRRKIGVHNNLIGYHRPVSVEFYLIQQLNKNIVYHPNPVSSCIHNFGYI